MKRLVRPALGAVVLLAQVAAPALAIPTSWRSMAAAALCANGIVSD